MSKSLSVLPVLILFIFNAGAQDRRLDSLIRVSSAYHLQDSMKVVHLVKVFRLASRQKKEQLFNQYVDSALLIANNLKSKGPLGRVYDVIGLAYFNTDRPKAIFYLTKAIETSKEAGIKADEAGAYLSLGSLYMDIRDYPKSLDAHEKSIRLYIEAGIPDYASSCYMNLGIIYLDMGEKAKGIEYTWKALKIFEKEPGSEYGVAIAYSSIADNYLVASDNELKAMGVAPADRFKVTEDAIEKGLRAARIAEGNGMVSIFYVNRGKIYEMQGNLQQASKYYQMALDTSAHYQDEAEYGNNLMTMGNFHINKLNNIPAGLSMLRESLQLARKSGRLQSEEDALRYISKGFEKQKRYDSALHYFRLAIVVKDSLFNQAKEQEITRRQLKIDFDAKEREYQTAQQLAAVQLASNRWLSLGLGVVAVIVFTAAVLIYNSRRKTLKLNRIVSEQKQSLEELVAVKDKIFSVVSHDMKGPVNNLVAFSSLLEDGEIEQERLALYLQQIRGTLDHTSSLMENLLNWSASQMQGFTPVIEKVDISVAVQHALQVADHALQNKKIVLQNTVMPGIYIKGDKNMTELIVRNLVNNAVKFSQQGGILELSATQGVDKVKLTIKDNGVGMDAGKVRQINSTSLLSVESTYGTAKEKGTGLGLMLSKHFAGLMGGDINVESKPGAGSRFDVSLPGMV